MKKSKFISLLTSLTVAGTAALSVASFSVSAVTSPIDLEMVSDKTTFTAEEVAAGDASTKIYVDAANDFTADEQLWGIEFELRPEEWGTVDPMNLQICQYNQLGTDDTVKGNISTMGFNAPTTNTISEWKNATPPKSGAVNFADFEQYTSVGPCDTYPAKLMLYTDSDHGYIRSTGTTYKNAGEHIAEFEVFLPENLAEGEYTINFVKAKALVGNVLEGTDEQVDIAAATGITITVGDGKGEGEGEGEGDDFLLGDANLDKKVNVRDCAYIASMLAKGAADKLPQKESDYNQDGKVNVRDAAALASALAKGTV